MRPCLDVAEKVPADLIILSVCATITLLHEAA